MPFVSKRKPLNLTRIQKSELERISNSRTSTAAYVERSQVILRYASGATIAAICSTLNIDRPKAQRTIQKALEFGPLASLDDLPGRGRNPVITPEANAWVVSLACDKPKDYGYSYELWTTDLLSKHVRSHCTEAGHPCLSKLARGTVSKILSSNQIRPHKIEYYLERRDPDFDAKMAQVLCIYKQVNVWRTIGIPEEYVAVLSYDEKPGIQAIGNTAIDLPPVPGQQPTWARDHEYVRYGTLSLLAAIDLLTGHAFNIVRDRHRSKEFIEFLEIIDSYYPKDKKIQIVLDNHSAHVSKETRTYLSTIPNRFEFVFTPKHGSWLNLVECFFAKMAHTMLRGIRVNSLDELQERIQKYFDEINEAPKVFKWKYKLESLI